MHVTEECAFDWFKILICRAVSHKVEVNGAAIHYDKIGHGKHHVLLLPGALGMSATPSKVCRSTQSSECVRHASWARLFAWSPNICATGGPRLSPPPRLVKIKHQEVFFRCSFVAGSSRTDFPNQIAHFNRDLLTVFAWDPRGYGLSIPPERTWDNFLHRDANDALGLMKVCVAPEFAPH